MSKKVNFKTVSTSKYLKYQFTEEEKKKLSQEMAARIADKANLEAEKKAVTKDFGSRIASIDGIINESATKLNAGFEMRKIPCTVTYNYDEKLLIWTRDDTGEKVDERMMTDDERQMDLPEDEE